jgi:hypothetical protein
MDRTPLPLTGYDNYSYNDNRMNSYNGNGSTNNIQGLEGTVQMDIQNSIDDRTGEEESYMQRSPLPHLLTADAGTGASILQSEQERGREEDEYDGDDWEEETHDAEQELYASAELREDSQGHFHGQQQQQQYHYQAQYQRGEEQWQGPGHGQEQEQGNYSYGQAYYQVGGGETAEESWDVDLDQLVSASNIHIGIGTGTGTGTGAGAGIGSTEDEDDGGDRWEQDLDSIAFRIGQDEGQEYGDGGGIGEETLELDADASVEYVQEQARGREVEETGEEGIYERLDYSDLNTTAEEFAPVTTHIPPVHAPIMGPPRQGQTQTTSQGQGQTYNSMV